MALEIDEPEILDGTRAWAKTQQLFRGQPDPLRVRRAVRCTWYDTMVDEHEGAFCVIQANSALEDLVGDFVRVVYKNKEIFLYCVGGTSDIPTPLAITRQAMLYTASLSAEFIDVTVQALR